MWQKIPPVVKNLIILNVLFFIITLLTGNFMYEKFSLFYFQSPFFRPYQLLTHMFMHGGFLHIFFNMYTLFIFGCVLENVWGGKKFLLYYLVTGFGAAFCHLFVMFLHVHHLEALYAAGDMAAQAQIINILRTPTIGASGAIYGCLLAYGMMFPNERLLLLFPPIAMKAKYFVIIFGVLELLFGVTGAEGNVAHFAHLGGMIFGFFMILYWKKHNKLYY
ncbi:MAG: rhomboid family intramembrane serine protease [Bacteroidales bacterium]|jgi:membrane associated rhomboid family serine protease|nr:rhomboid family intramembrane serine protease [Bacteroidales bacterium]